VGFCGSPNIDQCEIEKERTLTANLLIPTLLATECDKLDIRFINIGSGCIYCGESPNKVVKLINGLAERNENGEVIIRDIGWREEDFANPASFYSKTKYACDLAIGQIRTTTVLRIRMPLSSKSSPRNLISKLKGYNQVIDIPNSVTFVDDLVRCVDHVINDCLTGIYHVTNNTPLTAAQVMKEYQKYMPEHKFEIIDEEKLGELTKAKRSNCILNSDKLKDTGFEMSPTKEMLENCMKSYIANLGV
jgi:dTDP-4-dehydrorhamnose reductase